MRSRRKSTPRRKPRRHQPKQPQLLPPPRRYVESDGWRRTFLHRFVHPMERDALLGLSRTLDRLLHEDGSFWNQIGPLPESELRAAAEDLVHVAEFLRRVEEENDFDPYDDEHRPKIRLCKLASRLAVRVFKVANAIGAALPPEETGAA